MGESNGIGSVRAGFATCLVIALVVLALSVQAQGTVIAKEGFDSAAHCGGDVFAYQLTVLERKTGNISVEGYRFEVDPSLAEGGRRRLLWSRMLGIADRPTTSPKCEQGEILWVVSGAIRASDGSMLCNEAGLPRHFIGSLGHRLWTVFDRDSGAHVAVGPAEDLRLPSSRYATREAAFASARR
jgi:hypothetical protein